MNPLFYPDFHDVTLSFRGPPSCSYPPGAGAERERRPRKTAAPPTRVNKGGTMSEESMELPILRWHPNVKNWLPPEHVPDYVDAGGGKTIDENRLYWIADALLETHPEAERLRAIWEKRPGLNLGPGPDRLVRVWLAATGDKLGLFDKRWLNA